MIICFLYHLTICRRFPVFSVHCQLFESTSNNCLGFIFCSRCGLFCSVRLVQMYIQVSAFISKNFFKLLFILLSTNILEYITRYWRAKIDAGCTEKHRGLYWFYFSQQSVLKECCNDESPMTLQVLLLPKAFFPFFSIWIISLH